MSAIWRDSAKRGLAFCFKKWYVSQYAKQPEFRNSSSRKDALYRARTFTGTTSDPQETISCYLGNLMRAYASSWQVRGWCCAYHTRSWRSKVLAGNNNPIIPSFERKSVTCQLKASETRVSGTGRVFECLWIQARTCFSSISFFNSNHGGFPIIQSNIRLDLANIDPSSKKSQW